MKTTACTECGRNPRSIEYHCEHCPMLNQFQHKQRAYILRNDMERPNRLEFHVMADWVTMAVIGVCALLFLIAGVAENAPWLACFSVPFGRAVWLSYRGRHKLK